MAEGLCVYWRFNEIQAGRVLDASGMNNQGLLSPSANVSSSSLQAKSPIADEDEWGEKVPLGHSLRGEVSCASVQGLSDASSMTLEFHVRRVGIAQGGKTYRLLNFSNFIKLDISGIGTISLIVDATQYDTSKRIIINEWMHFALVLDEERVTLHADGVAVFSNVKASMQGNPYSVVIGSDICEFTEFRIFSIARTQAQIKEFMANPLPRPVGTSKWKGLRIKAGTDVEKPLSLPPQRIGALKSRRITSTEEFEESGPTGSPRASKIVPTQAIPDEPATAEGSVVDFPIGPKPISKPDTPEESFSSSRENTSPPELVISVEPERKTPPDSVKPSLDVRDSEFSLPDSLSSHGAISRIDAFLDETIAKKDLWIDSAKLWKGICVMSVYMRTKNRIGPYLCPMPNEEFLTRLRTSCNYFALGRCIERPGGYLACLRIPLLPHHVKQLTRQAINEAAATGDARTEALLLKRFILNFRLEMPNAEIEALNRRLFQLGHVSVYTRIECPLCRAFFRDPLQESCSGGCQSVFTICYVSGKLVPKSDCVKCKICECVLSTNPQPSRRNSSVVTSRTFAVPSTCPLCSCTGSLSPVDWVPNPN